MNLIHIYIHNPYARVCRWEQWEGHRADSWFQMKYLFQMPALPLTSCVTLDKLTSVYFDFLLCKMGTIRHLLYWVVGRIKSLCVCKTQECPAWGKSYVRVHYSCCPLSLLLLLLLLNVCGRKESGGGRGIVPAAKRTSESPCWLSAALLSGLCCVALTMHSKKETQSIWRS